MKILHNIKQYLEDVVEVCTTELDRIFGNRGVIMIFFVAGIGYPLLFNFIYSKENLDNVPVAVVDDAQCAESQRFVHKLEATPEVEVRYECGSMAEAERLMAQRKVNGIVHFPSDYGERLARLETARIGVFCDMSSFLYYKSVFMGANFAMLDEMKQIEFTRYGLTGITGEQANTLVTPVAYDDVKLFVPGGGFTSFLIPALLILVIQQTLFFGVSMLGGAAREDGLELAAIPRRLRRRHHDRVVVGRSMAYILLYSALIAIDIFLIPRLFNLPHIAHIDQLALFLLPFLLSVCFLSITCSSLFRHRESAIVTLVFSSIILLFLTGFAWPQTSMPDLWRRLSYIFPSTHAVQGFVRMNSMGATLHEVSFEYLMLWVLTAVYFITACLSVGARVHAHARRLHPLAA